MPQIIAASGVPVVSRYNMQPYYSGEEWRGHKIRLAAEAGIDDTATFYMRLGGTIVPRPVKWRRESEAESESPTQAPALDDARSPYTIKTKGNRQTVRLQPYFKGYPRLGVEYCDGVVGFLARAGVGDITGQQIDDDHYEIAIPGSKLRLGTPPYTDIHRPMATSGTPAYEFAEVRAKDLAYAAMLATCILAAEIHPDAQLSLNFTPPLLP